MLCAMTQTDAILAKFRQARVNPTVLAREMGLGQTTVVGWKKRGVIPSKQHPAVLEVAGRLGVSLEPKDFFPPYAGAA